MCRLKIILYKHHVCRQICADIFMNWFLLPEFNVNIRIIIPLYKSVHYFKVSSEPFKASSPSLTCWSRLVPSSVGRALGNHYGKIQMSSYLGNGVLTCLLSNVVRKVGVRGCSINRRLMSAFRLKKLFKYIICKPKNKVCNPLSVACG